jgi:hypothetical protein
VAEQKPNFPIIKRTLNKVAYVLTKGKVKTTRDYINNTSLHTYNDPPACKFE